MAEMSWENVPIVDRDTRERIVRFLAAVVGAEYRPGMVALYRRGTVSLGVPAEAPAPAPAPASAEAVLAALRAAGLIPAAAASAAAASAAPARRRGRPRKAQGGGQ